MCLLTQCPSGAQRWRDDCLWSYQALVMALADITDLPPKTHAALEYVALLFTRGVFRHMSHSLRKHHFSRRRERTPSVSRSSASYSADHGPLRSCSLMSHHCQEERWVCEYRAPMRLSSPELELRESATFLAMSSS